MLRPYKWFGVGTKLARDTDTRILKGGRMNQIIFVLIGIVVSGLLVITRILYSATGKNNREPKEIIKRGKRRGLF